MTEARWSIDSEYGVLTDVLLSRPDNYDWIPTNSIAVRTLEDGTHLDRQRLQSQYRELEDALEGAGVHLHYTETEANLPYQVYTRDSSQVTPWGPVLTQLYRPQRRGEYASVLKFYGGSEAFWNLSTQGTLEGGDIHIIRPGLCVIGHSGERTTETGAAQFAGWLRDEGWEVRLEAFDDYFLHFDLLFSAIGDGVALACRTVLGEDFLNWLHHHGIRTIDVGYKDAIHHMGCNVLALGNDRIVSPKHSEDLNARLRAEGFEVLDPELDLFAMGGGSVHCMTMPLKRESLSSHATKIEMETERTPTVSTAPTAVRSADTSSMVVLPTHADAPELPLADSDLAAKTIADVQSPVMQKTKTSAATWFPLPADPDWFAVEDMGHGIKRIHERHVSPDVRCNMFHVSGSDRDMIVDTGLGIRSLSRSLPWILDRPIVCVSSHSHFDHIGSTSEFSDRLIHPAEADILANPTNATTLAEWILSEMPDEEVFIDIPATWDRTAYTIAPAPATGLVEDGDVIGLGDRAFQVLHTPGHSPGGIALFEEATGIMIAGDVLYDGELITGAYHSNMRDYHASMRKLRAYEPSVVHAGHYESFGPERYTALITRFFEDYADHTSDGPTP